MLSLEHDVVAFLPCFLRFFSSFVIPVCFALSVQQSSTPLEQVRLAVFFLMWFRLCSVSSQDSIFFICFIFVIPCFLGFRVCCAVVPGTLAFDLPTLTSSRLFYFFLSLPSVTTQFVPVSIG